MGQFAAYSFSESAFSRASCRLRLDHSSFRTNRNIGLKYWKAFGIRAVWNECQFASHVFLDAHARASFVVHTSFCRVVLSVVVSRKSSLPLLVAADWMQFWSAKVQAKRFNWFDLCQLCRRVASESKWNHKICTTKVATAEEKKKKKRKYNRGK